MERINLFWIKLFYILVLFVSLFLLLHLITVIILEMEIKPTLKLQVGFCSVRSLLGFGFGSVRVHVLLPTFESK